MEFSSVIFLLEIPSARWLKHPEIWYDLRTMLWYKGVNTNCLNKDMTCLYLEVCLVTALTTVELSHLRIIEPTHPTLYGIFNPNSNNHSIIWCVIDTLLEWFGGIACLFTVCHGFSSAESFKGQTDPITRIGMMLAFSFFTWYWQFVQVKSICNSWVWA